MQVRQSPEVIHTLPQAYSVDLDVNLTQIKLGFNVDIDANSVEGSVIVLDEQDNLVLGNTLYANRMVTYKFHDKLQPNHTYRVLVKGDSESFVRGEQADEGIRSVLGYGMQKDFEYTLTTMKIEVPIPKIKTPSHYSAIDEQPVFSWTAIKGATEYELEVSRSNTFRPLAIPESALEGIRLIDTEYEWSGELKDGTYYARVRAYVDGLCSEWSKVVQFNIDTAEEGLISEDDVVEEDTEEEVYEEFEPMLEIVDVYPKEDASQVSLKNPAIAVRVLGDVSPDRINMNVFGALLEDEDEIDAYKELEGSITLKPNGDGTTWILFTPNKITEE